MRSTLVSSIVPEHTPTAHAMRRVVTVAGDWHAAGPNPVRGRWNLPVGLLPPETRQGSNESLTTCIRETGASTSRGRGLESHVRQRPHATNALKKVAPVRDGSLERERGRRPHLGTHLPFYPIRTSERPRGRWTCDFGRHGTVIRRGRPVERLFARLCRRAV